MIIINENTKMHFNFNSIYIIKHELKKNMSLQAPVLADSWSTRHGNRTACHSAECTNTRQVTQLSYLQQSLLQVTISNNSTLVYTYINN